MESSDKSNLLLAIVQAQDADIAEQALKSVNVDSYQMPSVGGFLGRKNITLIIDSPIGKNDEIIGVLKNSCSQRIEFIAAYRYRCFHSGLDSPSFAGAYLIFAVRSRSDLSC